MPPGGDGFYYFSTYLLGTNCEIGFFDIKFNEDMLCTVRVEQQETSGDAGQATCSVVVYATAGT